MHVCHEFCLVNALVIVNVWAFQSGFLFLSRFYYTRFYVDWFFLRLNVGIFCVQIRAIESPRF